MTSIGYDAFRGCTGLTSITIPNSVTTIESDAFYECTNLKTVTFAENSKCSSIGAKAFFGCRSLESMILPFVGGSMKSASDTYQYPFGYIFGTYSFYTGDLATKQYYYGSSISSITNSTYYIPESLKSVTIMGGNILYGAFYGCTGLTSITIPNTITSIGESAFYGCTRLTNITIPDSVTSIGAGVFSECRSLQSITLPFVGGSRKSTSDTYQYPFGYIFGESSYTDGVATKQNYYGSSTASSTYSTYYIPKSLKSVTITGGNILCGAFYGCTGLTNITIPNSVTSIGDSAFYGCTGLTSITIPDSVTSIGYDAFRGCTGLTSITIPNSIQNIGRCAFDACTNLKTVTFAENSQCSSIGYGAFYGCTGLTSITIPNSVTSIGSDAFSDCAGLTSIIVKSGNSKYRAVGNCLIETESKTLMLGCKNSVIPSDGSVTSIGYGAFNGCIRLTNITIPDSVTSIGGSAFSDCAGLTSITIPNSVTSIGGSAFYNTAYYNNSSHWENGVLYNGNYLIDAKDTISGSYTIKSGTKCISGSAFSGCTGLTSITIPDSVTSIGNYTFKNCSGLSSITIPDSVTSIGDFAFSRCTRLTNITISNSVTNIDSSTFYECTGLMSITIPDSVTSIGYGAFMSCTGLTSITIPNSVTYIDRWAFANCGTFEILFEGTQEEWEKIIKGYHWMDNSSYTVTFLK